MFLVFIWTNKFDSFFFFCAYWKIIICDFASSEKHFLKLFFWEIAFSEIYFPVFLNQFSGENQLMSAHDSCSLLPAPSSTGMISFVS